MCTPGEREEDKEWRKQERIRVNEIYAKLGQNPPKRIRQRVLCTLCRPRIEFDTFDTLNRHLISEHSYDYCQICSQIGPISMVRHHILERHFENDSKAYSCYICCGSGPKFQEKVQMDAHLISKHSLKTQNR